MILIITCTAMISTTSDFPKSQALRLKINANNRENINANQLRKLGRKLITSSTIKIYIFPI